MKKGNLIGWAIGLVVAIAVSLGCTVAFDLSVEQQLIVAFLSGMAFTGLGMFIGSTFDD